MWVLALGAGAVALAFAGVLARQWLFHRRPHQAVWAVAMLMYAAASLALFLGLLDGWSAGEFKVYWLFGAILNVPCLLLGELYLLVRRRVIVDGLLVALLFLTAFAVSRVRTATIVGSLSTDLPLGKDVFGDGSVPHRLAQYYAYPAYVLLVAACGWSAWRMRGRPELRDRFGGTLLIAVGATIVAIGSGVGAGLEVVPVLSVGLLAGVAVMFWGFLRASGSGARSGGGAEPSAGRPWPFRRRA
ncbi:MAG: hypothetical protein AB1551_03835 [Actinomycetota bacterium]